MLALLRNSMNTSRVMSCRSNVADHRPGASDYRFETEASSPGSVHLLCWAFVVSCSLINLVSKRAFTSPRQRDKVNPSRLLAARRVNQTNGANHSAGPPSGVNSRSLISSDAARITMTEELNKASQRNHRQERSRCSSLFMNRDSDSDSFICATPNESGQAPRTRTTK